MSAGGEKLTSNEMKSAAVSWVKAIWGFFVPSIANRPKAMKTSFLMIPVVGAMLASCSQTTGVTAHQVAAMNHPADKIPSRLTFQMSVKEARAGAKKLPATQIIVGKKFQVSDQREFIYPAAYEPASATADLTSVVPATPKDFQAIHTGIEADLTSERVGALLVFKGTIRVTDVQGFARMGGQLGQPIIDADGRLITENRIEMPKLATFSTPVYAALQPDGSCTFEISHPKKGTSVTFSIAPH